MANMPAVKVLSTMEDVWDACRQDLQEVEDQIRHRIHSDVPLINMVSRQLLSSGGKRIRPLLLILCSRLFGYPSKEALILGSLIEYIHTATLLHDDVLDEADLRRGKQTARQLWGNHASILVGDYLYSQAMHQIAGFHNHGFNEVLADACRKMAEGEVLQLCANHRSDLTESEYLQIIEYKTATLIAAACKIGAILGGASPSEQAALYRFGMNLGMAFQLTDDLLDYEADGARLGKPLGQDIRQGMITLPLLHLLKMSSPQDQQRIRTYLSAGSIGDLEMTDIMTMLRQYDSLTYVLDRSREYVDAAQRVLDLVPACSAKHSLAIVACFMVQRDQ